MARVVYGCDDPKGGAVVTLFTIGQDARLNHRFAVTRGVLERAHGLGTPDVGFATEAERVVAADFERRGEHG